MKIEGNSGPQDAQATESARRANGVESAYKRTGDLKSAATGDRVELSGDAALRSAALKSANAQPEVRSELVERMRAQLAEGKVGNDPQKLADSIIDSLLK